MTEEEIKALQEAKEAAEAKAVALEAALATERSEKEKAVNNLVEELKVERQKKQEALSKVTLTGNEDVNSLIEQALRTKDEESRKRALEEAVAEFKASKTEFQTDAAGLVFGKFQENLKKFNLNDLSTKEQVKNRLEEIYKFYNSRTSEENSNEYDGTPSSTPSVTDTNRDVNRDVKSVLDATGMDEAKYKTLKEKYPEALTGIGL